MAAWQNPAHEVPSAPNSQGPGDISMISRKNLASIRGRFEKSRTVLGTATWPVAAAFPAGPPTLATPANGRRRVSIY
jgi:hypothetical protein